MKKMYTDNKSKILVGFTILELLAYLKYLTAGDKKNKKVTFIRLDNK